VTRNGKEYRNQPQYRMYGVLANQYHDGAKDGQSAKEKE
jgi:hypothetical protein